MGDALAALEAAAAEEATSAKRITTAGYLLAALEGVWSDWMPGGVDRVAGAERTFLRPWWQALLVVSDAAKRLYRWPPYGYTEQFLFAIYDWMEEVAGEGEDVPLPSWNPVNEVSLHQLKFANRWPGHRPLEGYGIPHADNLEAMLKPVSDLPPFAKDFPADRSAWPAAVREAVEAALRKSDSLTPAVVPPFDPKAVTVYQPWRGPWPELTGNVDKVGPPPGEYLHDPLFYMMPPPLLRPEN